MSLFAGINGFLGWQARDVDIGITRDVLTLITLCIALMSLGGFLIYKALTLKPLVLTAAGFSPDDGQTLIAWRDIQAFQSKDGFGGWILKRRPENRGWRKLLPRAVDGLLMPNDWRMKPTELIATLEAWRQRYS